VRASIAIVLWCVSAFLHDGLGRGVAIYGCVVVLLIIIGIGISYLELDVHGMTIIMEGGYVVHLRWSSVVLAAPE
jgi:hypothetical protein